MFGRKARAQRRADEQAKLQTQIDTALNELEEAEQAMLDKAEKIPDPAERYLALVELRHELRKQSREVTKVHATPFTAKDGKKAKWVSRGSSGVGLSAAIALSIAAGPAAIPGALIVGLVAKGASWIAGMVAVGDSTEQLDKLKVFDEKTKERIKHIDEVLVKIEDEHVGALAASEQFDKILSHNPRIKDKMSDAFRSAAQKKPEEFTAQPAAAKPEQQRRKLNL